MSMLTRRGHETDPFLAKTRSLPLVLFFSNKRTRCIFASNMYRIALDPAFSVQINWMITGGRRRDFAARQSWRGRKLKEEKRQREKLRESVPPLRRARARATCKTRNERLNLASAKRRSLVRLVRSLANKRNINTEWNSHFKKFVTPRARPRGIRWL